MDDPESSADDSLAIPPATVSKPMLASEALMEDLAPQEPWRAGARWWSLAAGVLVTGTVVPGLAAGDGLDEAIVPLVIGAVAIFSGLIPVPYIVRGLLMLLAAMTIAGLALADLGPARGLHAQLQPWWLLHAAAVITLPAALMFRDRYRALPRARYTLGFSLFVSLGFVGYCVLSIASGGLAMQIASAVGVAAVVLSLLGFMGSQAPIAGSLLATFIIAAVTGQLAAVRMASGLDTAALLDTGAFLSFAVLGALGAAQCLAAASYAHARSIDFRRDPTERPPLPSLTSDSWSGRR